MKQLLAILILFFIVASSSYGQSVDSTKSVVIRIDCSPKLLNPSRQPLYVITYGQEKVVIDKEIKSQLERIGTEKFSSVEIMKQEEAKAVYGDAASKGAILISLDENLVKRKEWNKLKSGQLD
ncbi:hypothetical protein [Pontibacter sp. BAB1700]|uniref:hypothetical protein n=1 Tax=Pontibacter sp. BAB1700 TaxID=1144253 RepID=UPI00026BCD4C|nr:hypothetical protein [Pontibacter sp. BAB1700]EJF11308.1 hypothetical protein O71_03861 [Pontibacter sp. BAB1700]